MSSLRRLARQLAGALRDPAYSALAALAVAPVRND